MCIKISVDIHHKTDNHFSYESHQWDFPWHEKFKMFKGELFS